ncbi:SgcJ/EcaC family oxidoreductase [Tomitella biformata]|uniref:SgcJ/EcaC family oxidoreductase n=1 Tax=Tomitella biformata TaxID=630403 RepID=UPI00046515D1|nr:SgcJ/EcaC family oxidoreductase [Tomitella biformata]
MAAAEQIRDTVVQYLKAVASGDAAAVASLYAEDGTLEDPVGTPPRAGRAAITEFYGGLAGAEIATELLTLRVGGDTAAFHFRVTTKAGDKSYIVEPIDVMTFNEAGEILSMRAVWSPADMKVS